MNTEDWAKGYDVGNAGLLKAIETAEQIATMRERKRILNIIDMAINHYTKTSVFSYRKAIADLLKEINQ